MIRIQTVKNSAKISAYNTYNYILDDLFLNESELHARDVYYITKYRGDLMNDVNIGFIMNDKQQSTVLLYVSNGDVKIRAIATLNSKKNRIVDLQTKIYPMIIDFKVPLFSEGGSYQERTKKEIDKFLEKNPHLQIHKGKNGKDLIDVEYPKDDSITTTVVFV